MMKRKMIDRSSQTQNTTEEGNLKSYHLRPRRKAIKYKRHFRSAKKNQSYPNLNFQPQIQNSFSSLQLPADSKSLHSNSNRSSTTEVESSRSKSSNILTSTEEADISIKKENINIPLSPSSFISIKRSKQTSKLERPQTCPSSLCLRTIVTKYQNLTLNKKQIELKKVGKLDEDNHRQRAGVSLSDVVLRQKESYLESAHQSTSDKGLKFRFPRKRSIRTSLKDVLSSPKSKRRLIENSNQNSRDEEERNFLDLCSGRVEPMSSNDFASNAFLTVMGQREKEKEKQLFKENMTKDDKLTDVTFKLKKSKSAQFIEKQRNRKNLDISSNQGFQDRGEFIFDKSLQLMNTCFTDAIHTLHESTIIKKEKESRDFKLNTKTICSAGDKSEPSGLFSKMEEIVRTNEDGEKNKQDPEPGVERKIDRFRNLLEKISMLREDVTILLEDAAKNDKTLEFLKNLRNLSRSSNRESQERFLIRENINENLIKNVPQSSDQNTFQNINRNITQNMPQTEPQNMSQIEPQNMPQTEPQNIPQTEPQNFPQYMPHNESQSDPQIEFRNIPQFDTQNIPQTSPRNISQDTFQDTSQDTSQKPAQNHLSHKNVGHSKFHNTSTIDEGDDIQILKVINRNRPNFYHSETNLDGDFLLSLYQQLKMMPQRRKLKMRLKMQQLFYEEIYKVDSD